MKNINKYTKSADGAKIYYETNILDHKKLCLVFVHGLAGGTNIWNLEREFFKNEGVSSIALDLRGHGLSERSEKEGFYSFTNFENDVLSVIKAEKLENFVLIGHCLGGFISLSLASQNHLGLRSLVLIDSIYKTPRVINSFDNSIIINFFIKYLPNLRIKGKEDYQSFLGTGSIDIKRGISDILHVSLKDYLLICKNLTGLDASDVLNKIQVPTLIIEGSKDSIVPPEIAKTLADRIKYSELDIIEGANHFLIVNNPIDVSREIERFLIKRKII